MRTLKNLRLGVRLGAGFGIVLVLMSIMAIVSYLSNLDIERTADKIVIQDLAKVDALATIKLGSRDNEAQLMERFLAPNPQQVESALQRTAANKKQVDAALALLDKELYTPAGKALMTKISNARNAFMASMDKADKLLLGGNRAEAVKHLFAETMPAADALQDAVLELNALADKVIAADGKEIQDDIDYARTMMLILGLASLVLGIGFAWWVTRSVTVPVRQAVDMARTVAAGDLTMRLQADSKDEIGQLLAALDEMNTNLVAIVGRVRESSDSIATGSAQIATGNADLSQRTEEQASNLQETATSMEQLTSTVQQNADTARQANQLATGASEAATKGGEVVREVVATMEDITASSKRIADIIGVIDGIAFQTNILALNAAVEAARAGEQGRGFAVVAGEVRSLAQRSAEAAKEIKTLIGESVEKVDAGSRLVNAAGESMNDIVAQVKRVNDLIGEISAAGVEQSSGITQVGQAVAQLDQVTQQNAALVEESAAAAESLKQQAASLAEVVSTFKIGAEARPSPVPQAAPAATRGPNGIERRGPNRATNVTRPKFATRKALPAASEATGSAAAGPAAAKTGTDGWETF